MIDEKFKIMLIVGMHRSGTSAFTRVLNLLGLALPGNLGPPTPGENEKGFWEPMDLVAIDDSLLANLNSEWYDVFPLMSDWLSSEYAQAYKEQFTEFIHKNFTDGDFGVIKDPRQTLLLPLSVQILSQMKIGVFSTICFRHPDEVAGSLFKRNKFSVQTSYLLWLKYMLNAERNTRGLPRVFCGYHELLGDWRLVKDKISSTLGIIWPSDNDAAAVAIEGFLDKKLRHNDANDNSEWSLPVIGDWIATAYKWFCSAASNPNIATEVLDDLLHEINSTSSFYSAAFFEKIRTLKHVDREVYKPQLGFQNAELNTKFQENLWLEVELNSKFQENLRLIAELNSKSQENLRLIAELNAKSQENLRLEAEMKDQRDLNRRVVQSLSWRMTAPLRWLRQLL